MNTTGKTRAELLAMAEAIQVARDAVIRANSKYEVEGMLNARLFELRAAAEAMPVPGEKKFPDESEFANTPELEAAEVRVRELAKKLKAEAMPAQEPVAWLYQHDETGMTSLSIERWKNMRRYAEIPLYTTTPDQTAEIERLRGLLREAWQWIGPDHPLWDKDQPGTLEHLHDRIKAELGK